MARMYLWAGIVRISPLLLEHGTRNLTSLIKGLLNICLFLSVRLLFAICHSVLKLSFGARILLRPLGLCLARIQSVPGGRGGKSDLRATSLSDRFRPEESAVHATSLSWCWLSHHLPNMLPPSRKSNHYFTLLWRKTIQRGSESPYIASAWVKPFIHTKLWFEVGTKIARNAGANWSSVALSPLSSERGMGRVSPQPLSVGTRLCCAGVWESRVSTFGLAAQCRLYTVSLPVAGQSSWTIQKVQETFTRWLVRSWTRLPIAIPNVHMCPAGTHNHVFIAALLAVPLERLVTACFVLAKK